jgi:hypothetical protein
MFGEKSTLPVVGSTVMPGMVAHTCNPSYLAGEHRRIVVQGHPGKKLTRFHVNK